MAKLELQVHQEDRETIVRFLFWKKVVKYKGFSLLARIWQEEGKEKGTAVILTCAALEELMALDAYCGGSGKKMVFEVGITPGCGLVLPALFDKGLEDLRAKPWAKILWRWLPQKKKTTSSGGA